MTKEYNPRIRNQIVKMVNDSLAASDAADLLTFDDLLAMVQSANPEVAAAEVADATHDAVSVAARKSVMAGPIRGRRGRR